MQKSSSPMPTLKNQKGQGLVEYLIIVSLVAVVTMVIMRPLGQQLKAKFADIARAMGATVEGNINNARISSASLKKNDMKDFMQGASGSQDSSGSGGGSGGGGLGSGSAD